MHGGGKAVKSFIHIREVSRGELAALLHGEIGSSYHLSPQEGRSIRELVRTICRVLDKSFEKSTVDVDERLGQDAVYEIDSSRARNELFWAPEIDFEAGIDEVMKWIDENWDIFSKEDLEYRHRF